MTRGTKVVLEQANVIFGGNAINDVGKARPLKAKVTKKKSR